MCLWLVLTIINVAILTVVVVLTLIPVVSKPPDFHAMAFAVTFSILAGADFMIEVWTIIVVMRAREEIQGGGTKGTGEIDDDDDEA